MLCSIGIINAFNSNTQSKQTFSFMTNEAIQFLNPKKTQIEKRTLFVLPPQNSTAIFSATL